MREIDEPKHEVVVLVVHECGNASVGVELEVILAGSGSVAFIMRYRPKYNVRGPQSQGPGVQGRVNYHMVWTRDTYLHRSEIRRTEFVNITGSFETRLC